MIQFDQEAVFVVTGASSGIGNDIALKLNALGATVIAIGRNESRLASLKVSAACPEQMHIVEKDVSTNLESHTEFMQTLSSTYGKLSGLVLAAGMANIEPIKSVNLQNAREVFELNYFASLALARGFSHNMVKSASSSIVFVSSIAPLIGSVGRAIYASSKGAIDALVKSMALEFSRYGIRVNGIAPGHLDTNLTKQDEAKYSAQYIEELNKMYPLGRGKAQDISPMAVFLLSESSRWVTGQVLVVDGGRTLI